MTRQLEKDKTILSQACAQATSDDAQPAQNLIDTLVSMDGAACLAANQIGATTCIIAYLGDDDQPHAMYNPRLLQALGAFKTTEECLSLKADSPVARFERINPPTPRSIFSAEFQTLHRQRVSQVSEASPC